jgi:hypothetical protein
VAKIELLLVACAGTIFDRTVTRRKRIMMINGFFILGFVYSKNMLFKY